MTRSRVRYGLAVPAAVVALSLSTVPVMATAAPPADSTQDTAKSEPLGHAIGNAGALLSVVRALPGANGLDLPLPLPGLGGGGNSKSPLSLGFGLSSAQTNSEVGAPNSIAEAAPFAASLNGTMPPTPGSANQTAPPDNKTPAKGGFDIPDNPLITGGLLNTSAHARYSETLGPCVKPIAASKTTTADLSVISALPELPAIPGLDNLDNIKDITDLGNILDLDAVGSLFGLPNQPDKGKDNPLNQVLAPLKQFLGLFGGLDGLADGASVAKLPGTLSTESTVKLIPIKGSKNKAVQSTSKVQAAKIQLFSGTPLNLEIRLTSQPTLQVTSTGKQETSSIKYTKPLFSVYRDGQPIYEFDPDNPLDPPDLPLSLLPVKNNTPTSLSFKQVDQLAKAIPGYQGLASQAKQNGTLPVIGNLAKTLADAGLPDPTNFKEINLGVVSLQIGARNDTGETKRKGENKAPFTGYDLGSRTKLINVKILPEDVLSAIPELPDLPALPLGKALAEFSIGEQQAEAYAPTDGVNCGVKSGTKPNPPKDNPPDDQGSPPLAYTDAAYQTVPLLWTGAGMVLAGAVLVGYRPLRRALVKVKRR